MTLTYSDAKARYETARDKYAGKPLQNNTRLVARGSDYAVRLHYTDVVEIHADGTYSLNSGGWTTVTTQDRINGWSPARVHSGSVTANGYRQSVWCVWHESDPVTAPKIQTCRVCKGTGITTTPAYTQTFGQLPHPTYEVKERYVWPGHYSRGMLRIVGQVERHDTGSWGTLPVPVVHPAVDHTCHRCGGSGTHDYGSKPMPVIFFDGITVDATGRVVNADAWPRLHESADVTAGKVADINALANAAYLRRHELEAERFAARLERTDTGRLIGYKAVNGSLRSGWGTTYPIGETVTAPDWSATDECGHGLHFWPTIEDAVSWQDVEGTRYLACAVDEGAMVIVHGDKIKARSCDVLYEVDSNGNRL